MPGGFEGSLTSGENSRGLVTRSWPCSIARWEEVLSNKLSGARPLIQVLQGS